MASKMENWSEKHNIRSKKQFDKSDNEETIQSVEKSFRGVYFLFVIDQARSLLQTRFVNIMRRHEFLFNLERLKSMHVDGLLKSCENLWQYLKQNGYLDIIDDNLC